MSAEPFDNVLRYHVQSRTRPQVKHLVDLELYGGNGACSCEFFTFKLEPYLKKGARSETGGLRCYHINVARSRLADDVVRQATKQINGGLKPGQVANVPTAALEDTASGRPYVLDRQKKFKKPPPRKKAGPRRTHRA